MCQLRHPNIISAEDVYLPSDIPVEHRDSVMRLQRSNTDHICVRMPYYPADMSWLIHSSPQVLTHEHAQVTRLRVMRSELLPPVVVVCACDGVCTCEWRCCFGGLEVPYCLGSTFLCRYCAGCGECPLSCADARALLDAYA